MPRPRRSPQPKTPLAIPSDPPPFYARATGPVVVGGVLAAYLAALLFRADRFPAGICNDVAEEALRGLYLVDGHHFEVITFAIGNSAETLYLYVMGMAARVFGPTTLAIQAPAWALAMACIWMIVKLVQRIQPGIPAAVPAATAASSIWLFHYARSGLRAISAPFFFCAFALLLDRVERRPDDRWSGLLCGAVLGLGIYGYTAARVLPVAFLIYVAYRVVRGVVSRSELSRYVPVLGGAFLVSIPNVVFFLQRPAEFLTRGSYVFKGSASDRVDNLIASALFPIYYPDSYRNAIGPDHSFDGVCAGLLSLGLSPVSVLFAGALLLGLYALRAHAGNAVLTYMMTVWITGIAALGMAGPSLTNLLVILPAILVVSAIGFGSLPRLHTRLAYLVLPLIIVSAALDAHAYFSENSRGETEIYASAAATSVGKEAAGLAARGRSSLSLVTRDVNVVRYLTYGRSDRARVVEFYGRPFAAAELPSGDFRPDVLLVENDARFQELVTLAGPGGRLSEDRRYWSLDANTVLPALSGTR